MIYTVIRMSDDQINVFYKKHMKPIISINLFGRKRNIGGVLLSTAQYIHDVDDDIGFFSISTSSGKQIRCQVREEIPCFVDLSGFGNIRYEIFYPKDRENCQPFYIMLKDLANKAKDDFWKGGMI